MSSDKTNELIDVFISYAHADDEPPVNLEYGWVTTFVDELKKLLRRKLGGAGATVWMDHQLAENKPVTEALLDLIRRSRILVLFMSPGYSMSSWCQKELGGFLNNGGIYKGMDNVFIVELSPGERENWHNRLQELTPIRLWQTDHDNTPHLMGYPFPKPDEDDPYWKNLNKLAHLIADHLKKHSNQFNDQLFQKLSKFKPVVWIAEPTDDLIDQWESLSEAIRQAGADIRPLGIDTYPRATEAEFIDRLSADLGSAHLFIQLLSQVHGRHPKDSEVSFTALQSAAAGDWAKQQQRLFLQWRNREINLDGVPDFRHRQLLTGAISCGFEEFRQRVLASLQNLNPPGPERSSNDSQLAICISANKEDQELGHQISDILLELGADALTAPTEPAQNQTPTEFNTQWDEVIMGSEGLIIVYGQTPPAWVQAQYIRARKALAQKRKGIWGALLDGPPSEKPAVGLATKNLIMLDCRTGTQKHHIERFINVLRGDQCV